jgi:hypothetical protein
LRRPPPGLCLAGAVAVALAWACSCGGETCDPYSDPTCPSICFDFGPYAGGDYVFVDSEALSSPDGSELSPFAHLGPAIHKAGRQGGGIVVVAPGEYIEQIELGPEDHGVVVVSVCARDRSVRLTGHEPELDELDELFPPVISMQGSSQTRVGLAGLTIDASDGPGIEVLGGTLDITQLQIEDVAGSGLMVIGSEARVEASELVVHNVREDLVGNGFLLVAADGGALVVDGLEGSGAARALALAQGADTQLTLTDAVLDGAPLEDTDEAARAVGVVVSEGASALLTGVTISRVTGVGLELSGRSSATLERVAIAGVTQAETDSGGHIGSGVVLTTGSGLTARELVVTDTAEYGLGATDRGTWVDWVGGSVLRTRGEQGDPGAGIGLIALDGAQVTASEVEIRYNEVFAAVASGEEASLTLSDAEISDGSPSDEVAVGGGLLAQLGASLLAERVTIERPYGFGVLVDGASAELLDVAVYDTARGSAQTLGVGLLANGGSTVAAQALRVQGTQGAGLVAVGSVSTCADCTLLDNTFAGAVAIGAQVELVDSTIAGTGPDATLGGGFGVFADGSELPFVLEVLGSVVEEHELAAIYIRGPGSALLEGDVLAGGPALRSVWPTGTAVFASGTASGPYGLQLVGNTVRDSEGAGLFLDGGTAGLAGNTWTGNTVDIWQQLCDDTLPPPGLEQEQAATVLLCPPYDQPVELLSFELAYEPLSISP